MDLREFVNSIIGEVNQTLLKPLEDIESGLEGIVEVISENLNVSRPKVIATINNVDECGGRGDGLCSTIGGVYLPDEEVILVNYKVSLEALLHLYAHHLQAVEVGKAKYIQAVRGEEVRLPWELRPSEILAMYRSTILLRNLNPRVVKVFNEDVKPRVKDVERALGEVRGKVNYLARVIEYVVSRVR